MLKDMSNWESILTNDEKLKKNRWVIIDENETIDGGSLCAECEGNIERTNRRT